MLKTNRNNQNSSRAHTKYELLIQTCVDCHQHFVIDCDGVHDQLLYHQLFQYIKRNLLLEQLSTTVTLIKNKPWQYLSNPYFSRVQKRKSLISNSNQDHIFINELTKQLQRFPKIGAFQVYFQKFVIFSKLKSSFTILTKEDFHKALTQRQNKKNLDNNQSHQINQQSFSSISTSTLATLIVKVIEVLFQLLSNLKFLQKVDNVFRFLNLYQQPVNFRVSIIEYILRNTPHEKLTDIDEMMKIFMRTIESQETIKSSTLPYQSPKKILPYTTYNPVQKTERIRSIYKGFNIKLSKKSLQSDSKNSQRNLLNTKSKFKRKNISMNMITSAKNDSPLLIKIPKEMENSNQNTDNIRIIKRHYKKLVVSNPFDQINSGLKNTFDSSTFGFKSGFIYKRDNLNQKFMQNQNIVKDSPKDKFQTERREQNIGKIFYARNLSDKNLSLKDQHEAQNQRINHQITLNLKEKANRKSFKSSNQGTIVRRCSSQSKNRPLSSTLGLKYQLMQEENSKRNLSNLTQNSLLNENLLRMYVQKQPQSQLIVENQQKMFHSQRKFSKKGQKDFIRQNINNVKNTKRMNIYGLSSSFWHNSCLNNKSQSQKSKNHKKSHSLLNNKILSPSQLTFYQERLKQKREKEDRQIQKGNFIQTFSSVCSNVVNYQQEKQIVEKKLMSTQAIDLSNTQKQQQQIDLTNTQKQQQQIDEIKDCQQIQNIIDEKDSAILLCQSEDSQKCNPIEQPNIQQTHCVQQASQLESTLIANNQFPLENISPSKVQKYSQTQNFQYTPSIITKSFSSSHLLQQSKHYQQLLTNNDIKVLMELSKFPNFQEQKLQHQSNIVIKSLRQLYNISDLQIFPQTMNDLQRDLEEILISLNENVTNTQQIPKCMAFILGIRQILKLNPKLVYNLFQHPEHMSPCGHYGMWLFNTKKNTFELIVIDDQFPIIYNQSPIETTISTPYSLAKQFEFINFPIINKKFVWLMVLQKGMAKMLGGYQSLAKISIGDVFQILTGFPVVEMGKLSVAKIMKCFNSSDDHHQYHNKLYYATRTNTNNDRYPESISRVITHFVSANNTKGSSACIITFVKLDEKSSHLQQLAIDEFIKKYDKLQMISWLGESSFDVCQLNSFAQTSTVIEIVAQGRSEDGDNSQMQTVIRVVNSCVQQQSTLSYNDKLQHCCQEQSNLPKHSKQSLTCKLYHQQLNQCSHRSSLQNSKKQSYQTTIHPTSPQSKKPLPLSNYQYLGEITKRASFFFMAKLKSGTNIMIITSNSIDLDRQLLTVSVISVFSQIKIKVLDKVEADLIKLGMTQNLQTSHKQQEIIGRNCFSKRKNLSVKNQQSFNLSKSQSKLNRHSLNPSNNITKNHNSQSNLLPSLKNKKFLQDQQQQQYSPIRKQKRKRYYH